MTLQWRDYQRRRISFFAAWLGGFALFVFASIVAGFFGHSILIVLPVWITWIVSFFITLSWVQRFRCPRCGKRFLPPMFDGREPQKFLYPKQCIHCGLPKWSASNV